MASVTVFVKGLLRLARFIGKKLIGGSSMTLSWADHWGNVRLQRALFSYCEPRLLSLSSLLSSYYSLLG